MPAPDFQSIAAEYRANFAVCAPQPITRGSGDVAKIVANRQRYESVAQKFPNQLPWFVVALLHIMEAEGDFHCHLHNGDPLSARTVHVPKGRPNGQPPFTWEDSAWDALMCDRFNLVPAERWADLAGILYQLESYNGWGYRPRHVRTPYLWAGSNLEQPGKYVDDGVWSPHALSSQTGAAVLLKRMVGMGLLAFSPPGAPASPGAQAFLPVGESAPAAPATPSADPAPQAGMPVLQTPPAA
jgi:lysozyme family protein